MKGRKASPITLRFIVGQPREIAAGLQGWEDEVTITFKYREEKMEADEIELLRASLAEYADGYAHLLEDGKRDEF